jgi:hypothetical protein
MTKYMIYTTDMGSIILEPLETSIKSIPMNEENADYQRYLAWVAEGNTAEAWEPPTP